MAEIAPLVLALVPPRQRQTRTIREGLHLRTWLKTSMEHLDRWLWCNMLIFDVVFATLTSLTSWMRSNGT